MKKLSEKDKRGWLAQPLLIILITYGILFNLSRDIRVPLFLIPKSLSKLQNKIAKLQNKIAEMIPPIIYEPERVWRLALPFRNESDEALKGDNEVLFIWMFLNFV